MKSHLKLAKFVLLGSFIMLGSAPTVNAGDLDRAVYPGHMCEFSGVISSDVRQRSMWRRFGNGLFNMDNRYWVYICPILRTHSPTNAIDRIVANVDDAHPTQNPRCRLMTSNERGNTVRVTPYVSAAGAGRYKTVTLPMTLFNPASRNHPVLQMECVIPAAVGGGSGYSGLMSYKAVPPSSCVPNCVSAPTNGDLILR